MSTLLPIVCKEVTLLTAAPSAFTGVYATKYSLSGFYINGETTIYGTGIGVIRMSEFPVFSWCR